MRRHARVIQEKHRRAKRLYIILLSVALLLFFLFLVGRSRSYWDGSQRLRLIAASENSTHVVVLDPKKGEVLVFELPTDMQLEAGYGRGEWKIGSLWKLGVQEGIGGATYVKESLIRGLGIPVEAVFEANLTDRSKLNIVKSFLLSHSETLTTFDRIRLAYAALVGRISEKEFQKTSMTYYFGEELTDISKGLVEVSYDQSVESPALKAVSSVIQNLGGKVLSVQKGEWGSENCILEGEGHYAKVLAQAFSCEMKNKQGGEIHLILGKGFYERFGDSS